jgi:hypothetical protein
MIQSGLNCLAPIAQRFHYDEFFVFALQPRDSISGSEHFPRRP